MKLAFSAAANGQLGKLLKLNFDLEEWSQIKIDEKQARPRSGKCRQSMSCHYDDA